MIKKLVSLLLTVVLAVSAVLTCCANEDNTSSVLTEVFIRQELFRQYSLIYDTFNAAIVLEDGSEITGIGFSDYSTYYEAEDGTVGFFPAGFIADFGYEIPDTEVEKGLVIENLDFTDEAHQFVYDYETTPFMEHCVKDGQYLKYGVNDHSAITYETNVYERGVCDESLGALYSYDVNRFVFDPDVGNYIRISGVSLFEKIDYDDVEAQINQIIADQNTNFSHQEVVSSVHIAQEAVTSYFLSMQAETFLGYKVSELIEAASQLDPMQCIRITAEGFVVIDIDRTPTTAEQLTKWLVGAGCLIMVAGSVALEVFVPAARPLSGAIMGGAIDVFMQVVVENKTLDNVQWGKVAVAAASGAMLAWVCPLAASSATDAVIKAGASKALGKIAGYGVLTFSNSMVAGVTNLALAKIDGREDGWNAFLTGVAIGAASTVVASALSEAFSAVGPKVTEVLSRTKAGQWLNKTTGKIDLFIRDHQIHIKDHPQLESILAPKTVHEAAESAWREVNNQTGAMGGKYSDLVNAGDGTTNKHETPSFEAYNKANGITDGKRSELPSIKMDAEDHQMTASWGHSKAAWAYREQQALLISEGTTESMHAAIQMDIEDITSKFGTKYNDAIQQMLEYATQIGWW